MTTARAASCAAAVVAAAVLYSGVHWGATVGGGADSYGYVSQADLWRAGRLTIREPIARESPWPLAIDTWAPLGYRPAPGSRDTIVPLYSPGLPLLMALLQSIGGFCAAFLVVPLCGALTVWLTYELGRRLFDAPVQSAAAALLVAASPIFLYQLMNPMSDVPAAAAWTLGVILVASDWPLSAGLASSAALLIRPNLLAVAIVLLVWTMAARRQWGRVLVGMLPAAVAVAAINMALYGAPWISGYGSAGDLYDARYLGANLRQFGHWSFDTQTPIIALVLTFFVFPRIAPPSRVPHPRLLAGGVIAAVVSSYLFYIPFDAWWYLRFLLPMWPAMMVLVAVSTHALVVWALGVVWAKDVAWVKWAAWVVWGFVVAGIAVSGVRLAGERSAFELGRGERKYVDVARFVAAHTEPDAVIISLQHSGTLRLYAGRLTLRFDQLDGLWLDRAVAFLRDRGRRSYIVVDGAEVDMFRRRFAETGTGRLDWSPMATLDRAAVFVYDASDRKSGRPPVAIASTSRRTGWRCEPPYNSRAPLRME